MGVLVLSGSLQGGPSSASGSFPSSTLSEQLSLLVGPKGYTNASGILARTIASPNAFVTLPAVGASGDVTEADTLYFKSNGVCVLELTLDDGSGGNTVLPLDVHGLVIQEFPADKPLKALRVKGSCQIVYFVSGP